MLDLASLTLSIFPSLSSLTFLLWGCRPLLQSTIRENRHREKVHHIERGKDNSKKERRRISRERENISGDRLKMDPYVLWWFRRLLPLVRHVLVDLGPRLRRVGRRLIPKPDMGTCPTSEREGRGLVELSYSSSSSWADWPLSISLLCPLNKCTHH